jgi:hypothetical protein
MYKIMKKNSFLQWENKNGSILSDFNFIARLSIRLVVDDQDQSRFKSSKNIDRNDNFLNLYLPYSNLI